VKMAQKVKKIPVWRRALGILLFIAIVNQLSQIGTGGYGMGIVVAFILLPLLTLAGRMAEGVGYVAGATAGLIVSPIALLGEILNNPAYGIGLTLGLIGMIILAVWLTRGFGKRGTNVKRREL